MSWENRLARSTKTSDFSFYATPHYRHTRSVIICDHVFPSFCAGNSPLTRIFHSEMSRRLNMKIYSVMSSRAVAAAVVEKMNAEEQASPKSTSADCQDKACDVGAAPREAVAQRRKSA
jgi:hypothetical protein